VFRQEFELNSSVRNGRRYIPGPRNSVSGSLLHFITDYSTFCLHVHMFICERRDRTSSGSNSSEKNMRRHRAKEKQAASAAAAAVVQTMRQGANVTSRVINLNYAITPRSQTTETEVWMDRHIPTLSATGLPSPPVLLINSSARHRRPTLASHPVDPCPKPVLSPTYPVSVPPRSLHFHWAPKS